MTLLLVRICFQYANVNISNIYIFDVINFDFTGDITILIKASEPVNLAANDAQKPEVTEQKKEVKETAQPPGNGLDEQIDDLLSKIRKVDEVAEGSPTSGQVDENKSPPIEIMDTEASKDSDTDVKETREIEPIKEVDENGDSQESDKTEKGSKGPKESGRATPVRASSRLANVTPSTIRTRRASRLLQEQ